VVIQKSVLSRDASQAVSRLVKMIVILNNSSKSLENKQGFLKVFPLIFPELDSCKTDKQKQL
jgi:hypothetical protein